jgi:uncharacterized Ntn-hydrolase superfamily protein
MRLSGFRTKLPARALLCIALAWAPVASATWSIVAVDRQGRQVGVAAATCGIGVESLVGFAQGRGVVIAQGEPNLEARDHAVEMLLAGGDPPTILRAIASEEFDPPGMLDASFQQRQYALAALDTLPSTGAFTGEASAVWSGGLVDRYFAVLAGGVVGGEVVERAIEQFQTNIPARAGDCRLALADRLLRALEAGGAAGGDSSCPRGRGAHSALLMVAHEKDTTPTLDLVVPRRLGTFEALWYQWFAYEPPERTLPPLRELRMRYGEWVAAHGTPCFGASRPEATP